MKTFIAKNNKIKKFWYIINAKNKILGRLVTKIIHIIRGKHKTEYTPNINLGDYIIILNASKIIVSGKKYKNKIYYHHTGYIGGIKKITFSELINKNPKKILEIAIKGMLPKGPLGRNIFKKIKIYSGNEHKHLSQKPKIIKI